MKYLSRVKRAINMPIRLTFAVAALIMSVVFILLVILTTSPDRVGPTGITVVFMLVFIVILSTLTLVKMFIYRSTIVTINNLVIWALAPTIILGLRTLKQLTILDIGFVVLFIVLLRFYVKKATNNKT